MPPARSDVWQYVTVVSASDRNGMKTVKCLFCNKEFTTNSSTKISSHLKVCKFVQGNVGSTTVQKSKDKGKSVAPLDTSTASSAVASTSEASTSAEPTSAEQSISAAFRSASQSDEVIRKHRKITDWADRISEAEKKQVDRELSLAFFSGGVPFRFIENPHLLRAMNILRAAYEPPSRRQICNRMLDDCHSSIEADMNAEITKAAYVSVATDAWTNVNGESVINFIVLLPSRPVFYDAIYTADNRHTADYLAEMTSNHQQNWCGEGRSGRHG